MGMEDFRVLLRSRTASAAVVNEWVRGLPHCEPDSGFLPNRYDYYRIDYGRHVLEVEVSHTGPSQVSVRFMLCNPPSVEPAFLDLVRNLAVTFEMELYSGDAVGGLTLPWERFDDFAASLKLTITRRRVEWVMHFGPEQFPAGAEEAGRWIMDGERPDTPATLLNSAH